MKLPLKFDISLEILSMIQKKKLYIRNQDFEVAIIVVLWDLLGGS